MTLGAEGLPPGTVLCLPEERSLKCTSDPRYVLAQYHSIEGRLITTQWRVEDLPNDLISQADLDACLANPFRRATLDLQTPMLGKFTCPIDLRIIGSAYFEGEGVVRLIVAGLNLPADECHVAFYHAQGVVRQVIKPGPGSGYSNILGRMFEPYAISGNTRYFEPLECAPRP